MNQLKITISGPVGSGKTTMARYIKKILVSSGFKNVVMNDLDVNLSVDEEANQYVQLIEKDFDIQIDTVQLNRESIL